MKTILFAFALLLFINSHSYSKLPADSLVGYWPFNGNAQDAAGTNDGVVNGATLCRDRFGRLNSAYYFDGINDNISLLFPSAIDLNTTSTIMLWFKADEVQNSYAKLLCVPYSLQTWTSPYHFLAFSGPAFNYANFDPTNGMCDTDPFTATVDTIWNLLSFTYDMGNIKVYINGQLKQTLSCTNKLLPAGGTMSIGSRSTSNTNNGEYFTGIIDDIAFYNKVLSQTEISAYYNYVCSVTPTNVTTSYYVSDENFKKANSRKYLDSTVIVTSSEGCDSTVNYYSEYNFSANYHTDTLYVSVTDTLFIKVTNLAINTAENVIKVYPNPTKDKVFINTGDKYQQISDYSVKIISMSGTVVFDSKISKSQFEINISDFGKAGLYYIQILDNNNKVIENRKIILTENK